MTFPLSLPMRLRMLTVGAALLALGAPATAQHERAAEQSVTAVAMAHSGLTRIDDLFWWLDGWTASSLDGYATRPSAVGLPGPPLLVVGKHFQAAGPFGLPRLAMLPVHQLQIRRAHALQAPRLVSGRLASDGAVQFALRRPRSQGGTQAAVSAGNEVGDPGPFLSTSLEVPNVDRIGPQYFAAAHAGSRRTRAQLSFRAVRHFTTDRAIRPRVDYLRRTPKEAPPLQRLLAPRFALETQHAGRHRLHAQYATLRALSFFETLGHEVPVRRQQGQVGIDGQSPSFENDTGRLNYRFSYTHTRTASTADRLSPSVRPALVFEGSAAQLSGNVALDSLSLTPRTLHLHTGISADYTRTQASASLRDPSLLTTRIYARLNATPLLSAIEPRLTLLLSQTDRQFGGGVLLSGKVPLSSHQRASVHIGYVHQPYVEGGPRWYWWAQGMPVPMASSGRVDFPSSFPSSHRITGDVRFEHTFDLESRVAFELGARHFRQLGLPHKDFGFDTSGNRLVPKLRLRSTAGQTFRVAVEGKHSFPAGLHHRLRYDFFAHHATGDERDREAFDQRFLRLPRHQLHYTAQVNVRDRFSLQGRFTARSRARWPAYRRAARAAGSPYRHRLPTYALLNLTATKRFWADHLRLRLSLRNLLDVPLRTHPAGPVQRLTLYFSVEATL